MTDDPIFLILIIVLSVGVPLLLIFRTGLPGFGGKIPKDVQSDLDKEGILFSEDSIPLTVRLRKFRAPGRYSSYSVKGGRGALVVTRKRIVSYVGRAHCLVDVPLDHPKIEAMDISVRKRNTLCISFEASEFNEQQSGGIEIRYGLADIRNAVATLRQVGISYGEET